MRDNSSAIKPTAIPLPRPPGRSDGAGLAWGLLGVVAFSFTVPFTRIAVDDGLSPLFVGAGRAVVAAVLAAACLVATSQRRPTRVQWRRLLVVAGGVVVGFPLLTSYALTQTPASHGAVVIGLLPVATAAVAVLRAQERVATRFWVFAAAGALGVVTFAGLQGGGLGRLQWADVLLVCAVLAAAVGYAEGGLLARELGAWQTVSWALVTCSPLTLALTIVSVTTDGPTASTPQWLAFAYLACVSMFLGFVAWYRGLAIGPMAQVSQVQLVQPVLSILWAALLLREQVGWETLVGGFVVVTCACGAVRTRLSRRSR